MVILYGYFSDLYVFFFFNLGPALQFNQDAWMKNRILEFFFFGREIKLHRRRHKASKGTKEALIVSRLEKTMKQK